MTESNSGLQDIPLFHDLGLEEIAILDSYLSSLEIGPDEVVFNEGDDGDYVGFILQGKLSVIKKNITGQETTVAHIQAGRSFGEMALVDSMQRSATIRAKGQCHLRVLHRRDFDLLKQEHPAIAAKILQYIARSLSLSLRRTSNQLTDSLEDIV
jgi:CRP-like cAMP-binding protein